MEDVRIRLKEVVKVFDLNSKANKSALENTLSFLGKKEKNKFVVLNDINLEVKPGENIGLIGKNGSGKSTLLRVIAGIYRIDKGEVEVSGELVYLTGFGYGLKPKLTMTENIFLSGSLMGLGQDSIKQRFDEIVEFSGLKDYLDTKLFKFSTGMQIRLASSIVLHCVVHRNPDILLIDEVLGAGADTNYQEKALRKMEELLKGGASVVFVSHNLEAVKEYCDRVIWLEKGKVVMEGNPEEVTDAYLKSVNV
ncbi:MAG: ATP-binding cassette domain-containing protein [archaeon]